MSPTSSDEYGDALAINPYMTPAADDARLLFIKPYGILAPTVTNTLSTTLAGYPYWMIPNPKDAKTYVYAANGSIYSLNNGLTSLTSVGDLNDGGTASGNGCEYYDNYMYFARDTTVARYGPLNGIASFTDDYWASTLGKTALSNTTYDATGGSALETPNHVLHRHSDGKLYIADVVGGQGTIHYIKTSKTTVEGDTDNGSTYDALDLPFGYYPTAMASYGDFLVIGAVEMTGGIDFNKTGRARIIFWDTTSPTYNQIIDTEFSSTTISKIVNVNGTLFVFSGRPSGGGLSLYRYIGGNSLEEVAVIVECSLPLPGAVFHDTNSLYFAGGTYNFYSESSSRIYMYDLRLNALHCIGGQANQTFQPYITSIAPSAGGYGDNATSLVYSGYGEGSTFGISKQNFNFNLDAVGTSVSELDAEWISKPFNIGQPFKILKVRVPLLYPDGLTADVDITPSFIIDANQSTVDLTSINITNYATRAGKKSFSLKPPAGTVITGENSFRFRLKWNNGSVIPVDLPITIEYELLDDEA